MQSGVHAPGRSWSSCSIACAPWRRRKRWITSRFMINTNANSVSPQDDSRRQADAVRRPRGPRGSAAVHTRRDYRLGYSMFCNVVLRDYFPFLERAEILLYVALRRRANPGFTIRISAQDLAEAAGVARTTLYEARRQLGPEGLGLISWTETDGGRRRWATYTITRNPPPHPPPNQQRAQAGCQTESPNRQEARLNQNIAINHSAP